MSSLGAVLLSEVAQRLMMMSGSGASTFAAEYGRAATSRINEVASTPSQRTSPVRQPDQELASKHLTGRGSTSIRPPD